MRTLFVCGERARTWGHARHSMTSVQFSTFLVRSFLSVYIPPSPHLSFSPAPASSPHPITRATSSKSPHTRARILPPPHTHRSNHSTATSLRISFFLKHSPSYLYNEFLRVHTTRVRPDRHRDHHQYREPLHRHRHGLFSFLFFSSRFVAASRSLRRRQPLDETANEPNAMSHFKEVGTLII